MKNAEQDEHDRLVKAIRETWRDRRKEVDEFGLRTIDGAIEKIPAGWTVPVCSMIPTGSALRLAEVLRILQDGIETKSKLWITLYLDPFADTTKNGDN